MRFLLYHPYSHPVVDKRAKVIMEVLRDYHESQYLGPLQGDSRKFGRVMHELYLITRLIFRRKLAIHLVDFSPTFAFLLIPLKLSGKIIIFDSGNIHCETLSVMGKPRIVTSIARVAEKVLLRNSNFVISRGYHLMKSFVRMGAKEGVMSYVPDPVNIDLFDLYSKKQCRKALGLEHNSFIIGYVANFEILDLPNLGKIPRGWELIDSLRRFKALGKTNVRAIFIGTGRGLDQLKQLSNESDVNSMCIFLGFVEENRYVKSLLAIDVGFMEDYELLAYQTSVGAKIQDYMAAGKIVVAGKGDERDFLLESQLEGHLLFDPLKFEQFQDVPRYLDDIFNIFSRIEGNLDSFNGLGGKNRIRGNSLFGVEVVSEELREVYVALCQNKIKMAAEK